MASLVSVKLSSSNFLLWKSQIFPLIRSAQLLQHLEEEAPATTITKDGKEESNPDYDIWLNNDGLLTSWLLGTMNEEALSLVVSCDTAFQIWKCLKEHYLASTKEQELHLKGQLAIKRGDSESLEDFIRKFKGVCDKLAAIRKPLDDLDKVFQLSRVVGIRYQPYNLAVLSKEPYPTFNQYTTGLLNNERDIQAIELESKDKTPAYSQVFVAQRGRGHRGRGYGGKHFNSRGRGFVQAGNYNNNWTSNTNWASNNRSNLVNNNPTPQQALPQKFQQKAMTQKGENPCQICGIAGHTALKCWYRFDHAYQSEELPQALATFTVKDKDENYYVDTGASDNMIFDSGKLYYKRPYNGNQKVFTGDGTPLHISHIGSASLGRLKLNDVLVVPNLKKNLISISKVTDENPYIFEFSSNGFVIKDQITQAVVAKGTRKGQLYALEEGEKHALIAISNKASDSIWHQRLGHPNSNVLRTLASKNNIAVSNWTKTPHLCSGCQMGKSYDHSRYTWFYPLHKKSDFFDVFQKFQRMIATQFNKNIQVFQCDGGGEFSSKSFLNHLAECGIKLQVSCPRTPEQNGVVERKHRRLVETEVPESTSPQGSKSTDGNSPQNILEEASNLEGPGSTHLGNNIHENEVCNSPVQLEPDPSQPIQGPGSSYCEGVPPPAHNATSTSVHPMTTKAKSGKHTGHVQTTFPKFAHSMTTNTYSLPGAELDIQEPKSVKKALQLPHWNNAMQEELDALHKNNTWTLVPRPSSQTNIVGSKWVFKTKLLPNGTVDRFKARLVAQGYSQIPGVDFEETFSPVLKPTTLRLVVALATTMSWPLRQLDVKNAFLHGKLKEEVYMTQPPGFEDASHPEYVCKLNKSIYGLKQAPRAWFDTFTLQLLKLGFHCSQADSSLFVLHHGQDVALLLLYVDDIVLSASSQFLLQQIIDHLGSQFDLKDLGPLNYFLGIEVTEFSGGIFLSQAKYAKDILTRAHMFAAASIATPLATKDTSTLKDDDLVDANEYRKLVGALQYLTITRTDICHAVNRVCQFMQQPTFAHMRQVKRILRYIKGTIHHGLRFSSHSTLSLTGFCDADWAGCPITRRSTTGYCVFLGANCISWSSKKQPTIARSTAEAEYRALATTTAEIVWVTYLLRDIGVSLPSPPQLFSDNLSALHIHAYKTTSACPISIVKVQTGFG
ncbi:hypothetical protein SLEP1_g57465 [Rubroshorea leprosula]|uniref:Integrase catalytic domain-containing protein n=1 Tax=Rubroshorea leprosula TaxID=152421 RepID=A0AAV5MLM9_9ROSI|nr:hypothetical protein SLEP1_g57465 [Rubroshorea leprosula]